MEHTIPNIKAQANDAVTEDELLETLTIISLLSKNLAKKVLLIPKEEPNKGGGKVNGNGNPRQSSLAK